MDDDGFEGYGPAFGAEGFGMGTIMGREPVAYLALVRALVVCLVAFGFGVSAEQTAGIYLAAEAVLSFVARSQVTPVEAPRLPGGAGLAVEGPADPLGGPTTEAGGV